MYVPLCEAWPLPPSGCPDITGSPEVTGAAVMAASEYLWALSGYQFGTCEVTVRPCRRSCAPMSHGAWASRWWDGAGWPVWDTPASWWWWDAMCGRCSGGCACSAADTLRLPELAQSVTSVVVDGAVVPAEDYALYDGRLLVRTDGERWPLCQDWAVPVSGVGAWSVTMEVGAPVPVLGQLALGSVARQFIAWCDTGECRHPAYMTQKTRQGVSQSFPTAAELRREGLTGWAAVDTFLDAVNPNRIRGSGAKIWNPDDILSEAHGRSGIS